MIDSTSTVTNVQSPLSLEQLAQQLTDLQSRLDAVESKLPFQNMAAITLVADESNLTMVTEQDGSSYYKHQIKIDHPLSNNNPKAIVVAINQAETDSLAAVNVFYDPLDSFWYISTPNLQPRGFEIDVTVDAHPTVIPGISGSDRPDFRVQENSTFRTTWGIAYVGPRWPGPGLRFSILIFTELPTELKPIEITTPVLIPQSSVSFDGDWHYKFASESGSTFEGTISLEINDTSVTGNMSVSDDSKGTVVGTLINNVLSLTRDTGLQTVQILQLNGIDANHFSGTYLNHGVSADSGTIELSR